MPRLTLIFAVLLIIVGAIGYPGDSAASPKGRNTEQDLTSITVDVEQAVTAPKRSITALIPAFTGVLLALFGGLANVDKWRKHPMHAAAMVSLLGLLAAGKRGATGLMRLVDGGDVNTRSLFFECAMAALCGIFVAICINSFVHARRRRQGQQAALSSSLD